MATRPISGTQTQTISLDPSSSSSSSSNPQETLVLRLRPPKKKVQWKEGTVDNEHMNKKKSKICCIFHKEKPFDEDYSDDEDSKDSSGGSGSRDPEAEGPTSAAGCCSHGRGGACH